MNGVDALMTAATALASIDPEDRFCPFCRSLLAVIEPLVKKELIARDFDQEPIDVVYKDRVSPHKGTRLPHSLLEEMVGLQSERSRELVRLPGATFTGGTDQDRYQRNGADRVCKIAKKADLGRRHPLRLVSDKGFPAGESE